MRIAFDPWVGRSSGGGHGNPLHYSCLENPQGQRSLEGSQRVGHHWNDLACRVAETGGANILDSRLPSKTVCIPFIFSPPPLSAFSSPSLKPPIPTCHWCFTISMAPSFSAFFSPRTLSSLDLWFRVCVCVCLSVEAEINSSSDGCVLLPLWVLLPLQG